VRGGRGDKNFLKIATGNASAIRNFRTFICIPYFDYETYFPGDRTIDGETELCLFFPQRGAHHCVVLTHHCFTPSTTPLHLDTFQHLHNRVKRYGPNSATLLPSSGARTKHIS
jgi:hypothetical protein